jgi:hypothetical protein
MRVVHLEKELTEDEKVCLVLSPFHIPAELFQNSVELSCIFGLATRDNV